MALYNLQKETHASNRDLVLRAIREGSYRFSGIFEKTKISKRTLTKILEELQDDLLVVKTGEGQKIRYALTTKANEIFKAEISGFREISEAYQKWHPSLELSRRNIMFTVGSLAHFPIIQTGSIFSGREDADRNPEAPLNENNVPEDRFVVPSDTVEGILHESILNAAIQQGMNNYQRNASVRHGKQHIAVVIDYDLLQNYFDMADSLEDAIIKGDHLTLFYSRELNADLESDSVLQEMLKTGMMGYSEFYSNLSNRQRIAFIIAQGKLPALLKIILYPKSKEDRSILMRRIGKAIDGPFMELIDIYRSTHNTSGVGGNTILEKIINLYGGEGVVKHSDILEFASILLLNSLRRYGMMKDPPSNESEMEKIF